MIATIVWLAVAIAGFALTLSAILRMPPPARPGWLFISAGVGVLVATGVAIGFNRLNGLRVNTVWASPALIAYPLLVTGLVRLRRVIGIGRSTDVVDALVVALGAFLIGWLVVLRRHFGPDAALIAATIAQPIGALIVLTTAVGLAFGRGLGRAAGALLVASAAVLLVMATILAVTARPTAVGLAPTGSVSVLWAIFPLFVAAAGLQAWPWPPVRGGPSEPAPLTAWRVSVIIGLALLGPVIWVVVVVTDEPVQAKAESAVPVLGDAVLSILLLVGLVVTGAALQRLRDQLRYQATHDSLTGLGNRAALGEALDEAFASDRPPALMLLDLDGFKDVNDRLGHPVGDAVLVAVADRLHRTVPAHAVLTRLGGDEFAVLLRADYRAEAPGLADRICDALRKPYHVDDCTVNLSASIGLVLGTVRTPTDALRKADVALYAAKAAGRDRWAYYRDEAQQ